MPYKSKSVMSLARPDEEETGDGTRIRVSGYDHLLDASGSHCPLKAAWDARSNAVITGQTYRSALTHYLHQSDALPSKFFDRMDDDLKIPTRMITDEEIEQYMTYQEWFDVNSMTRIDGVRNITTYEYIRRMIIEFSQGQGFLEVDPAYHLNRHKRRASVRLNAARVDVADEDDDVVEKEQINIIHYTIEQRDSVTLMLDRYCLLPSVYYGGMHVSRRDVGGNIGVIRIVSNAEIAVMRDPDHHYSRELFKYVQNDEDYWYLARQIAVCVSKLVKGFMPLSAHVNIGHPEKQWHSKNRGPGDRNLSVCIRRKAVLDDVPTDSPSIERSDVVLRMMKSIALGCEHVRNRRLRSEATFVTTWASTALDGDFDRKFVPDKWHQTVVRNALNSYTVQPPPMPNLNPQAVWIGLVFNAIAPYLSDMSPHVRIPDEILVCWDDSSSDSYNTESPPDLDELLTYAA